MNRTSAIRLCRYYSGEDVCPFQVNSLRYYWDAERVFVSHGGEINEPESRYYDAIGGKDYPSIPRGVLINLFFVWGKGVYDKKEHLSDFYVIVNDYLEVDSDYFPVDEIPH